ncbi:hypothetical protein [Streptomyces sp. NPDC088733]|uniref:hypothetical protein n=1 Tax=Streptomyces sp. NPDC088733 TaxID=3365880 RepID=UPI00382036CB
MARRHTTGWEALGFDSDPTPGDPEAIRTLSRTYRDLGDQADQAYRLLGTDAAIRHGKGQAMAALQDKIKDMPRFLDQTRTSFHSAADAYSVYAGVLTEAQSLLDRAIDQGGPVATTASVVVPDLPQNATPEETTRHGERVTEVGNAKSELSAATALAQQAQQMRADGSAAASRALDEAADQAIPARNIFQKIGDWLADHPIFEIIIGIFAGLVAIFFPVVGILIGALAFGLSVIRMVSQGHLEIGELIVGLLTIVPGGVLLGQLGRLGNVVSKFAPLGKALATAGRGAGTMSAAVKGWMKTSTFTRKVLTPLGRGVNYDGLKVRPAFVVTQKAVAEGTTEFALGATATVISDLAAGKQLDAGRILAGAAVGAAVGGGFAVLGGTKFANNLKDAFTTEGKFKSNIGKAFSASSFTPGSLLHVNGREMPQKTGFHGITSKTEGDQTTGALKTKVTTPDGTTTETKTEPPTPKPAATADGNPPPDPKTTTKTTTPDGFTSKTSGGTNTIESPQGDKVTYNGTRTSVDTPAGNGSHLTTTLTDHGFSTANGPFGGGVTQGADGTVAFSGTVEAGTHGPNPPAFTVGAGGDIHTGGLTVHDAGGTTTVSGDGVSVQHQGQVTSVFHGAPGNPPVVTHDTGAGPGGTVDVGLAGHHVTAPANGIGGGVDLPGHQHVAPPQADGGVPVQDNGVTGTLHPDGTATVSSIGGPATHLSGDGFTVVPDPHSPHTTVQFDSSAGHYGLDSAVHVTTQDGPSVSTDSDGIVTVQGGPGGDGGTAFFTPDGVTLTGADGAHFTVGQDGAFTAGGIDRGADGTITAGGTTVHADGTADFTQGGFQYHVGPDGAITPVPGQIGPPGPDGVPTQPPPPAQAAPGHPVTHGNLTVSVDGHGTPTVGVQGTSTVDGGGHVVTTTASVSGGTTTLDSGGFHVTTGPNGTTATGPGFTAHSGPGGITAGAPGGPPAVSVTLGHNGGATVAVGGSTTTLGPNGATTHVNGGLVATGDGTVSSAPVGQGTTVDSGAGGAAATVNDGQGGAFTVRPGTDGAHHPTADITHPDGQGAPVRAQVGANGISSQGVTVQSGPGGNGVSFSQQGNSGTTTTTSSADGSVHVTGPDGTVEVGGQSVTVTNASGQSVSSAHGTVTAAGNGHTTTLTPDGNGHFTTRTVDDRSGTGHTVDGNGQLSVENSPSGATITATHDGGAVHTPPGKGPGYVGGPPLVGGDNTLTNGAAGTTVTTHGAHPYAAPGSTVTHNGDGHVTVEHGAGTGSYSPGGVTHLGPNPNGPVDAHGSPVDTGGTPIGNGPGQTPVSTVTGDGQGGITVRTPGGGPAIHHTGGFGGRSTVDTGNVTVTKSDSGFPNATTPAEKSGVLPGKDSPFAPQGPPATFTVGANHPGGPTVQVPIWGGGSSVTSGGLHVGHTGNGTFQVGGPGGAGDSVTVRPDNSLVGGPGVHVTDHPAVTPPPGQQGPSVPAHQTAALSDGTTVTTLGGPAAFTPPGGAPGTTVDHGTATTTDPAGGVTITQNPHGSADFRYTGNGETTTLHVGHSGVTGSVDSNGTTHTFTAGDSSAVTVRDAGGTKVAGIDGAGGFTEQHSAVDDYDFNVGSTLKPDDYREFAWEAARGALKGVIQNFSVAGVQIGLGADPTTALENAGLGVGTSVANGVTNKQLENSHIFNTKGPEVLYTDIPVKFINTANDNQNRELLNPPQPEGPVLLTPEELAHIRAEQSGQPPGH